MTKCELCNKEFETFQAKANHIRWNHKDKPFSDDGLKRLKEKVRASNQKRYGNKTLVTEKRTCICGVEFVVSYYPERYHKGRKTCSSTCAARRMMSEKGKESLRQFHRENPDVWVNKGIQSNKNFRFSSKAERELAHELAEHGFKRHHIVRTQGITFDVDIVSLDKMIWIESDGSWHLRKIHDGHNFETTKLRDKIEEQEAIDRQVLLIRVNNETTSVKDQTKFILEQIQIWDRLTGKIVKFGFEESKDEVQMSATAEILAEQIRALNETIAAAQERGEDVEHHKKRLNELSKQLNAASKALNENKQLLKG